MTAVQLSLPLDAAGYDERYLLEDYESPQDDSIWAWSLESIKAARNGQMVGDFRQSAPLADACHTDPAIFGASLNRVAPSLAFPVEIEGPLARINAAAEAELEIGPDVYADIAGDLAWLGLWIGTIRWTQRKDGSRWDAKLETWPASAVWWDEWKQSLCTTTRDGRIVEITPGDGKWVVIFSRNHKPWRWGAVKAVGMHWGTRAYHIRDRTRSSETHGQSKYLGELPEGVSLDSKAGQAMAKLVKELRNKRSGGVHPFKGKVYQLEAVAQMWQIWKESIGSIDSDFRMALLGQDGSVSNEGGNYIKSAQLFKVRSDIVEGDLGARDRHLTAQYYRPWSALNFGELERAPRHKSLFPDPDEAERKKEEDERGARYAQRFALFLQAVQGSLALGFEVDVAKMAERFNIDPPKGTPKKIAPPAPAPADKDDDDDREEQETP